MYKDSSKIGSTERLNIKSLYRKFEHRSQSNKTTATKMMFKVIGNHDMVSEKILNL